ncbi:MAG: tRNA (adenosine(37)-N6)-threonylcarbamoyltransferase complex transferase subunit TsaD [Mariniblastus sp.]|nr:tRNA (adenosine(37)-N6)-threonylcarbamoyltransferase complex transferase subunit TsaD [Mariniblastus sp.]
MKILALETTCDETAAAIVASGDSAGSPVDVLGSVVASQTELHLEFKGVVPEIAARAHVERILPVIHRTVEQAGIGLAELDAVAVANTPGLSGSLMVGLMAAKSLCLALEKPLIAVNHLQAHIYACQLDTSDPIYPSIGMIVSGGHSHLYRFDDAIHAHYLGGTIDDAAGEAFDKVAAMLGLGYPGGPEVSRVAENGDETAWSFPRSFIHEERLDFSFSGLKTAVRYAIAGPGKTSLEGVVLDSRQVADLAASFQAAVVDCLVSKAMQALRQTGLTQLCVGGGVAANRRFRQQLEQACQEAQVRLHIAPLKLCTDNAVMGAIAIERYRAGLFESLDLDIAPGLVRVPR